MESPLYIIGIWDDSNALISWDDTKEWAAMLNLPTVPTIYEGTDFKAASTAWKKQYDPSTSEGFVIRDAAKIPYELFGSRVAKYVRANHVQTSADWRNRDDFALNGFKDFA